MRAALAARGLPAAHGARGRGDRPARRLAVPARPRARRARVPRDGGARLRGRPCRSSRRSRSAAPTRRSCSGSCWRCSRCASPWSWHELRDPRPRRPLPLSRRAPGARRRRPARHARRARRGARAQRRRQDDADAPPQRAADRRGRARGRRDRGRPPHAARAARARRPRLPGPRRPAVHADRARGRRVRAAQPRAGAGRGGRARRRRRSPPCGWRTPPGARRTSSRWASAGGSRSRPCSRCARACSCSTSRRRASTRARAASCSTCSPTSTARCWSSPTTSPFAGELCERAVILSAGRIVADGPCRELLADAALLAAHDLELPAGFDLDRLELRPSARARRRPRPDRRRCRRRRAAAGPGRARAGRRARALDRALEQHAVLEDAAGEHRHVEPVPLGEQHAPARGRVGEPVVEARGDRPRGRRRRSTSRATARIAARGSSTSGSPSHAIS